MASEDPEHKQLQEHIRSQEWNRALEITFQLLETQPQSSWLHTTMGKIYTHLNELTYAETSYKSAIYYHPHHADAHTQLGHLYLKMNRIGSADDHCKQALAIDSSDTAAWVLYFHIKLAYGDIPSAKESYTTIKSLGADQELLSTLNFNIIRHPLNKTPIDADTEITSRLNLLEKNPKNPITHSQLAYLYNRFTTKNDLAEKHIQTALADNPTDPQSQETSTLIRRKKKLWLRILTAPAQALTRPQQIHKTEVAIVGLVFIALIILASFGARHPWMARAGIFSIIAMFFCSYTANLSFQYLHSTEIIHQHCKISHFKAPFRTIHCLRYPKRRLLILTLTLISWAVLALTLFLITR